MDLYGTLFQKVWRTTLQQIKSAIVLHTIYLDFRNSIPAPHLTNYFFVIRSMVLHSHKLAKIGHMFCFYFFI